MWPCAPTGWWPILLMLQRGRVTARPRSPRSSRSPNAPPGATSTRWAWRACPSTPSRAATAGGSSLGGGRTDLSGLTAAEAQALFLVAGAVPSAGGPAAASAGQGGPAQAGARAARVVPRRRPRRRRRRSSSTRRRGDRRLRRRPPPPHLDAVQRAVIAGDQLTLGYVARDRAAATRVVHPLGLATKRDRLVPRRRHRCRAAHLPRRPHHVGRAHRRAGGAPARLRSRRRRGG